MGWGEGGGEKSVMELEKFPIMFTSLLLACLEVAGNIPEVRKGESLPWPSSKEEEDTGVKKIAGSR